MANGEPVNERPLLPSLHRTDAVGVGHWSSDLIRQLITVFQQYGFRINQSVTEDALAAELADVVRDADILDVLRDDDLAENSGTIPEVDRVNNFTLMQLIAGQPLVEVSGNEAQGYVRLAGLFAVCWRRVTPSWTIGNFQSWSMPLTFAQQPGQFTCMANHVGDGGGNAAIGVVQGAANSPTTNTFRIAFRDGTDASAAGDIMIFAMGPV